MSVTLTDVAPLITWLLVRISPLLVSTIPVPSAVASSSPRVDFTSTMPGSTLLAIALVFSAVRDAAVVGEELPCERATPPAAPAARATTAVAVRPSAVRPRRLRGGSGMGYCPYGYGANGSLMSCHSG